MAKFVLQAVVSALFGLAGLTATLAQDFPTRPMTMIIPFAAGGPTDVLGRVVAARMSEILGQQVVVENVGGAGGMNGSNRVANAAPDGYTFVLGTVGTHAQGQTLYKKPLYNAVTDFTPVALLAEVPILLVVRKDLPPKDFKEFVAYAKANQAKMQFGSAGAGSATHLGCVLLNHVLGIDVTHVPYRGTGPAMQDLQGGRIDYLCEIITTAKPQVDGGTVRALAIFDTKRSPALPNLPTALEQGTPDLVAYTWNAIVARQTRDPAGDEVGQDDAVVQALHAAPVPDHRRSHAKRDDVRERVELPAHRRCLLPPPGDAAVQNVEDQGGENETAGELDVPRGAGFEEGHRRKQRTDAADGIGQREPVGQVELPDHREGLVRIRVRHRKPDLPANSFESTLRGCRTVAVASPSSATYSTVSVGRDRAGTRRRRDCGSIDRRATGLPPPPSGSAGQPPSAGESATRRERPSVDPFRRIPNTRERRASDRPSVSPSLS